MIEFNKLPPEVQAQAPVRVKEWTEIALSTGRMTDEEKDEVKREVRNLYKVAKLTEPLDVYIEPSPLAMARLFGAAAWWWHENPKAKKAPSRDKLEAMMDEEGALACARRWHRCYQGGNMWAGLPTRVSFLRDDCGLKLKEFGPWAHWEALARISGFRVMHEKFCVVSEKPLEIHTFVDERGAHVAHNEEGPSHLWADGWAIYSVEGVQVPGWVITDPDSITVEKIRAEENMEVQRIMRQRYGEGRFLADTGAKVIDVDSVAIDRVTGTGQSIERALLEDQDGNRWLVGSDGSTKRVYHMRVPNEVTTCRAAHEALWEDNLKEETLILEA